MYEPGHTEAVLNIVEKLHYDVNSVIPSNGLTLFMVRFRLTPALALIIDCVQARTYTQMVKLG